MRQHLVMFLGCMQPLFDGSGLCGPCHWSEVVRPDAVWWGDGCKRQTVEFNWKPNCWWVLFRHIFITEGMTFWNQDCLGIWSAHWRADAQEGGRVGEGAKKKPTICWPYTGMFDCWVDVTKLGVSGWTVAPSCISAGRFGSCRGASCWFFHGPSARCAQDRRVAESIEHFLIAGGDASDLDVFWFEVVETICGHEKKPWRSPCWPIRKPLCQPRFWAKVVLKLLFAASVFPSFVCRSAVQYFTVRSTLQYAKPTYKDTVKETNEPEECSWETACPETLWIDLFQV